MLPYSAEAWFALVSAYNEAIRPVPALALFLVAAAIALAVRSRQNRSRPIAAILVGGWLWTGLVWHIAYFRDLNFMAGIYGAVFFVEAALLAWAGMYRDRLALRFDNSFRSWAGFAVALASAVVLPLADWLNGESWTEARFALIAPAATAGLTAGLLVLSGARVRYLLIAVPVIWLFGTAVQGWILGVQRDYLSGVLGLLVLAATFMPAGRRPD